MLSQPSENALALNQISKSYAGKQVLSQLNLAVPYGSVYAFLGNNGEGKSTTIRVLTGLEGPDAGSVTICGDSLYAKRRSLLSRSARFVPDYRLLHRLGGLIDAPSLYPNLTAAEFLSIGCGIKGLPVSEIDRVLAVVSLTDAAKRLIGQFCCDSNRVIVHTIIIAFRAVNYAIFARYREWFIQLQIEDLTRM